MFIVTLKLNELVLLSILFQKDRFFSPKGLLSLFVDIDFSHNTVIASQSINQASNR